MWLGIMGITVDRGRNRNTHITVAPVLASPAEALFTDFELNALLPVMEAIGTNAPGVFLSTTCYVESVIEQSLLLLRKTVLQRTSKMFRRLTNAY
jgi:hypothetical protein